MAHTYTIIRQEFIEPGVTSGTAISTSVVRITGTVDGTPVSVITSFAVVNQGTAIGYQNAVTPLLLAAWSALQPPATQTPPVLTWTQ